jgi:N-acetyl-gamma-glutamyl-phosphate reductase
MTGSPAKIKVSILGASGYGGAELLRRLQHHPRVALVGVSSRKHAGQPLEAAWPQLAGSGLRFSEAEEALEACDVLLCAAPHGAALEIVKRALEGGKRVVDLSADYRLSPEDYARWYGIEHPFPELCARAVYGLSELHREEIQDAVLVANPGCYPTAATLALAPLAARGLLGEDVIISAASGVSGAGREASMGVHYSETNENYKPYKIAGGHRHTAEIENSLGRLKMMGRSLRTHGNFEPVRVTFAPHLAPMTRGILATCFTRCEKAIGDDELLELYEAFYRDEPLVHVQRELPQTKAVYGSDRCLVSVRRDPRSGHVIAVVAIDNLGKGAAGQAVQNLNLMCGFEETLSLSLEAVYP